MDWIMPLGALALWAGFMVIAVASFNQARENSTTGPDETPAVAEAPPPDEGAAQESKADPERITLRSTALPEDEDPVDAGAGKEPERGATEGAPSERVQTEITQDEPDGNGGESDNVGEPPSMAAAPEDAPEGTRSPSAEDDAAVEQSSDLAQFEPDAEAASHVARAQFTTGIEDREPVDRVESVFPTNGQSIRTLYYFTDIVHMAGEQVVHHWEYEGEVIAEVEFDIGSDRWRTWSSKDLLASQPGEWRVIVTDSAGNVMETDSFLYTDSR